jgi:hypothetical protein
MTTTQQAGAADQAVPGVIGEEIRPYKVHVGFLV